MKRKHLVVTVSIIAMLSSILVGCNKEKEYIDYYKKDMQEIFGEYSCEYLGTQTEIEKGLGEREYKAWEITYTNVLGNTDTFELRDDADFTTQIKQVYEYNVALDLKDEILSDYIENLEPSGTYCDIRVRYLNDSIKTVEGRKLASYQIFNIENIDCDVLLDTDCIKIQTLIFSNDDLTVDSISEEHINSYHGVVNSISEIIDVTDYYCSFKSSNTNGKEITYIQ